MLRKICLIIAVIVMSLSLGSCKKEIHLETEEAADTKKVETEADSKEEEQEEEEEAQEEIEEEEEEEPKEKVERTDNYEISEVSQEVKIVVDGRELTPVDNNGKELETILHNGVVYLPAKTVAEAAGIEYYWDGPNYTAYLGNMDGSLEYPTVELEKMTSINDTPLKTESLTDNYGNRYSRAVYNDRYSYSYEYLLNMKYSRFKGILYVPEGVTSNSSVYLSVIADGKTIYTSPEMTKSSSPVEVDVNVTGYNDVKIKFSNYDEDSLLCCLGEAGFYQ